MEAEAMNLQEFAALKAGDKIENPMNDSTGTVSGTRDNGVHVQWGPSKVEFFYSVNSTAWMHWSKVEDEPQKRAGNYEDRIKLNQ